MIITIAPQKGNRIIRARQALMLARMYKQTAELHQDWLDLQPLTPNRNYFVELIKDEQRSAKEQRLTAKMFLQEEEKDAGEEFCQEGHTVRGAVNLDGQDFMNWSEHHDVFGEWTRGDLWI